MPTDSTTADSLTAILPSLTANEAADPKIRLKLLQIQRRRLELEIRSVARGDGSARGPVGERPTWGPCTRCGHIWRGYYSAVPPAHCANCHSRYWNRERIAKGEPTGAAARAAKRSHRRTTPTVALASTSPLPPPPRSIDAVAPPPAPRPLADYLARAIAEEQPERGATSPTPELTEMQRDDIRSGDALRDDAGGTDAAPPPPPGEVESAPLAADREGDATAAPEDDVVAPGSNATDEELEVLRRLDGAAR